VSRTPEIEMATAIEAIELANLAVRESTGLVKGRDRLRGASERHPACHHCGLPCDRGVHEADHHAFCCNGCRSVYVLLRDNGLDEFYRLREPAETRVEGDAQPGRWSFLDAPEVRRRLLDFENDRVARVTFHLPAIHCVACVWLLENLFRLRRGVGRSQVNFARREVAITFAAGQLQLSELAALLAGIGYEPALTLEDLDRPAPAPARRLALQIGVAGFAFGNIMLLSLPAYLGYDSFHGQALHAFFGGLNLALALPSVIYSASGYWRSAWASVSQRTLTLDVPIAAGLAALYLQSFWEITSGRGAGYLDSLAGLIFFLLCGRAFQQRTHDRLGFDRDYRGFFPLAVLRRTPAGQETIPISNVVVGDRLIVRNGELIPADCRLIGGEAAINYSFVTGESGTICRKPGDHLYAGGRQSAGAIEVEIVKPVSESYLTSLWNDDAFRKRRDNSFQTLTNRYSRRFTILVVSIALVAAAFWIARHQPGRGLKAFTSVLIVACPCALALAAPFTLGTMHRLFARQGVFLRNAGVIEALARIDTVVFDKTGTLTSAGAGGERSLRFVGEPLDAFEEAAISVICRQSVHPYARFIASRLKAPPAELKARGFRETPGRGMQAAVDGRAFRIGSGEWLSRDGIAYDPTSSADAALVHVGMDGRCLGRFELLDGLRPAVEPLLRRLKERYHIALLSGDNPRDRERFTALFGTADRVRFNQSPHDKLAFIRGLQRAGRRVMMVGDGLNDAGALRCGEVGVAVAEGVGRFTPASDVILETARVPCLGWILQCSRVAARVVCAGFVVSALYNVVGVSIAAAGVLSPLICAVLMPLSSVSVVLFTVGATHLAARRGGLTGSDPEEAWKS
jgi:Cu+-exporting ATPase